MRIVGLDLSLTSTGIAFVDETTSDIHTQTIKPRTKATVRLVEIRESVLAVVLFPFVADVVVVEGYSYGSGNQAHQVGELGGIIRLALHEHAIPAAVVAPAQVKSYVTGKGNAAKALVVSEATKRSGRTFMTDDEADAWVLREMGCHHYGQPHVPMPAASAVQVARVDWPVLEVLA